MHDTPMQSVDERRRAKGLTRQELADASGVSRSTIYRLEAGKAQGSLPALRKLALALDCSVADLLEEPQSKSA